MTPAIEFYFDFVGPYSYLACTQLPGLARRHRAEIVYRPFRLLELMKRVGNRPTTIECKNKQRFGSPSFVVGDELFFGNDRLDFVAAALARANA